MFDYQKVTTRTALPSSDKKPLNKLTISEILRAQHPGYSALDPTDDRSHNFYKHDVYRLVI
jgi:hypothetical protein